jgi:hypothetical protein
MSERKPEEDLEAKARLFKALGHPVRLLIVNLVQMKPRHGEELAEILHLNPATVSHHLAKLTGVGLLRSEKVQYYQTYSLVGDVLDKTLGELMHLPQPGLAAEVEEDAYRNKVLRTFFQHGRLRSIPVQRKKRQIILEKIIQEFEPEREYSHREVNQILVEFHEDVATLRRELVATGLMQRSDGIYRRG